VYFQLAYKEVSFEDLFCFPANEPLSYVVVFSAYYPSTYFICSAIFSCYSIFTLLRGNKSCILKMCLVGTVTIRHLEEWSRTADLFLTCSTKETWDTRNFGAYGLSNNPQTTPVCNLEEILPTKNQKEKTCTTPCYWDPDVPPNVILRCGVDDDFTMEMFDQYKEGMIADGLITSENLVSCDCPCSSFVEVQPPRFFALSVLDSRVSSEQFNFVISPIKQCGNFDLGTRGPVPGCCDRRVEFGVQVSDAVAWNSLFSLDYPVTVPFCFNLFRATGRII
jgi:hypothetical protein